jgi:hypothetical protein
MVGYILKGYESSNSHAFLEVLVFSNRYPVFYSLLSLIHVIPSGNQEILADPSWQLKAVCHFKEVVSTTHPPGIEKWRKVTTASEMPNQLNI